MNGSTIFFNAKHNLRRLVEMLVGIEKTGEKTKEVEVKGVGVGLGWG